MMMKLSPVFETIIHQRFIFPKQNQERPESSARECDLEGHGLHLKRGRLVPEKSVSSLPLPHSYRQHLLLRSSNSGEFEVN
jgi:hypothetical protein